MNEHVFDDETLMVQVGQGKREALEPLVRRFATPLLTFIERMVGNRHQAEELFQEVFLAVWVKRGTYEHPRPFRTWLYTIALNKCRTLLRRPSLPQEFLKEESSVSTAASPVDLAIATETGALVADAVARLPQQQRAVMVLRIWQQLPYSEIAGILETSEGTVRSNMHHGLCAMRKHLEPRLQPKNEVV
jgi:RNA polymerase sigma-70 factor (ECF subfamily)